MREYCVHYSGWNTRYDEWIAEERIASRITMNNNERIRPSTAKVRADDENSTFQYTYGVVNYVMSPMPFLYLYLYCIF